MPQQGVGRAGERRGGRGQQEQLGHWKDLG